MLDVIAGACLLTALITQRLDTILLALLAGEFVDIAIHL
jgi:hypothetical protein